MKAALGVYNLYEYKGRGDDLNSWSLSVSSRLAFILTFFSLFPLPSPFSPLSAFVFSVMLRLQSLCCVVSFPVQCFLVASRAFSHILTLSATHFPTTPWMVCPWPPSLLSCCSVSDLPSFPLTCSITFYSSPFQRLSLSSKSPGLYSFTLILSLPHLSNPGSAV